VHKKFFVRKIFTYSERKYQESWKVHKFLVIGYILKRRKT